MSINQSGWSTFRAEAIASFVFSVSYFVWLGRTASDSFSLGFLDLALGVGVFYVAAVFVSSWDYKADFFPPYSLLRCLTERSLRPLIVNVGGQILGTIIGFAVYFLLFTSLLSKSPFASPANVSPIVVENPILLNALFASLLAVIVYFTIVIRKIFRMSGFTGTLIVGLISYVVSAIAIPFKGLSIVTMLPDMLLGLYTNGITGEGLMSFMVFLVITIAVNLLVFYKLKDHRVVLFYRNRAAEGLNAQKND